MSRSRGYCFTLNNWTPEDTEALVKVECQYLVYGKEVGEEGTPHLQGYVYFKSLKSFKQIKTLLGDRYHIEAQRGSTEQAADYCKKDGDFHEVGVVPMSQKKKGEAGKRVYEEAFELAKQGKIDEIPEPLRTRFYGTYKRIRADHQVVPEALPTLEHEWYWGESGTGKTRKAREENPGAYLKNPNKWWCGYVDQAVVVIDEWAPTHECLAPHLKQWADHHPFCAETKGASLCIRPKKIIVTSNYSPEQCFPKEEDLEPIRRRFHVVQFSEPFKKK